MPQSKLSQFQSNIALRGTWFHIFSSHAIHTHEIGSGFNLPQTDISHHKHPKLLICQRSGFVTKGMQSLLGFVSNLNPIRILVATVDSLIWYLMQKNKNWENSLNFSIYCLNYYNLFPTIISFLSVLYHIIPFWMN